MCISGRVSHGVVRYMVRYVAGVFCGVALLGLAGCDQKSEQQNNSASQRAAQEITERIQGPQDRARAAQDQILQTNQRIRDAEEGR